MSQVQKRKFVQAVNTARELVRASGEIHYTVLALRVGYSPEYFRRTILRVLQQLEGECIVVDSKGIVKYVCDHEDAIEQQAREEAEEFFRGVGISG